MANPLQPQGLNPSADAGPDPLAAEAIRQRLVTLTRQMQDPSLPKAVREQTKAAIDALSDRKSVV